MNPLAPDTYVRDPVKEIEAEIYWLKGKWRRTRNPFYLVKLAGLGEADYIPGGDDDICAYEPKQ